MTFEYKVNRVFEEIVKVIDREDKIIFKNNYDKEKAIDALFDIIVYAYGALMKAGFKRDIPECIAKFQKDRLLDKQPFIFENEMHLIIEEMFELLMNIDSKEAREYARKQKIKDIEQKEKFIYKIVIEAKEAIKHEALYICVLKEGCKEINSRTGKIINGKFVKDKNTKTYKADFNKCYKSNFIKA